MNQPVDPSMFGSPDKINLDFDNKVEGPHVDIIQKLSATDTLKTRVGLNGEILSQDVLQKELRSSPPADPGALKSLDW